MNNKPTVAVLFGGRSVEHSVSCVSGSQAAKALRERGYSVRTIGITRSGSWLDINSDATFDMTEDELPEVTVASGTPLSLELGPDATKLADVVFPIFHGPWGEDGTVQGLLDMAQVPYVGSGVLSSAVCMDKDVAKRLTEQAGIAQGPYVVVGENEPVDQEAVIAKLGLPLFVKPARAGSSLGISKVTSSDDLTPALEKALRTDPKLILEAAVPHVREIEVGVRQERDGSIVTAHPLEVLEQNEDGWFDFDAKYLGSSEPFNLKPEFTFITVEEIQKTAEQVFRTLECRDYARIDFFLTKGGELMLNEVNTSPGLTPVSGVPQAFNALGVSYGELVESFVLNAAQREPGALA
ncbi:D-alanine--D-alanine ligase family protein [Haloglycomyces albus]|uniref:D-alanine--D-alanine ligase family protein n=1 Tax=Haloglycomyces albus TaxID=526067 RepID=UPI00046C9D6B|nr:D-alanine--D-alanine ligase family protein [Haloglycomyces albus]